MARQVDLEPIQVSLGEEFQPFLGMKKLRRHGTPDIIGESRLFDLKEIGQGRVTLLDIFLSSGIIINGNILSSPENKPQLIPAKVYLRKNVSQVLVDIHPFLPHIKTQPNIKCSVRVGKIQLAADNIALEDNTSIKESAFFCSFIPSDKSEPEDLLVPPKLSFLKDLSFRFESK